MRPVVFEGTVGWLHPADGSRGVVIAGAHGLEDLCSRGFLTLTARRIAARGLPALQFDYPGCGDAAGDHAEPGRVPAWRASIASAIDRLKRETGVADVLVIGFRLGALLAPAAVAGRGDVAGMALLAPPSSGKAYVREMTGLSRMIDGALPPYEKGEETPFDGLQAAGFRLSGETVAALSAIDWRADLAASTAAGDVLIMPAAPSAQISRLAEERASSGRPTSVAPFEGYHRLMCDPTANEVPAGVVDACADWAGARAGTAASCPEPAAEPDRLAGDGFRERPIVIGGGPEIGGVLCLPTGGGDAGDVVLLLNAGAVPHIGWARGTVETARALAAAGRASLRIDLPGLGQSEDPPQKRLFLYDERTGGDIARAVDWLEMRGFRRVCASGTCSGAFQAFHAARRDGRITHLAMVNPLCFDWNSSYALDMGVWKAYENSKAARSKSDGEDDAPANEDPVGPIGRLRASAMLRLRRLVRRVLELNKSSLAGLSVSRFVKGRKVERWMSDLVGRGTAVLMVTSEGDLSLEEIARHFGPNGERLARMPAVAMRELPAADHTLTPVHARRLLAGHLLGLMDAPRTGRAGRPGPDRPASRPRLVPGET